MNHSNPSLTFKLKTILRLLSPIEGKIYTSDGLLPDEIGYLPQQSDMQKDFPATVIEIIMSGFIGKMGWRPFYKKSEKTKALKIMEELDILDLMK